MVESITSAANPLLKDVRRAISRGGLTKQGWCVAETFHLLEEAVHSGREVRAVLAAESALDSLGGYAAGMRIAVLPDALFQSISGTETAQGVMALVKPPVWRIEEIVRGNALLVILDELQDPGNVGAIVRAAEAFGASGAIFVKGTVSPYNPKTLRASAGSLFRLPVLHGMDAECARHALIENHVRLFATGPAHDNGSVRMVGDVDLSVCCGLIIGNEARGVGPEWRSVAEQVSIPTVGVESLNAAVAAGILLYEAQRQRAFRL
jgi:RNA methyltransferase, TrmH family